MVMKLSTEVSEKASGKVIFQSENVLFSGSKISAVVVLHSKRFRMSTLDSGIITILDGDSIRFSSKSGLINVILYNEDINALQGERAIKNDEPFYFLGVKPAKLPFHESLLVLLNNNRFRGQRFNVTAELIHEPRITRERD